MPDRATKAPATRLIVLMLHSPLLLLLFLLWSSHIGRVLSATLERGGGVLQVTTQLTVVTSFFAQEQLQRRRWSALCMSRTYTQHCVTLASGIYVTSQLLPHAIHSRVRICTAAAGGRAKCAIKMTVRSCGVTSSFSLFCFLEIFLEDSSDLKCKRMNFSGQLANIYNKHAEKIYTAEVIN